MKPFLLAIMVIIAAPAHSQEVRPCQEVSVGIETLVTPVVQNVQSFYNNRLQIYNIDTTEPAAASAGIAIVMPDSEDPLGGKKCLAIRNFAGIDIKASRSTYDPDKGLSLSIPTRSPDFETGKSKPGPALNILINLQQSSVTIQRDRETDAPKLYVLARPASSQVGLTLNGEYYWFSNNNDPCDIVFEKSCFIKSDVRFVQISKDIISINDGKAFGCSPAIIPDTSKTPGYESGYGECTSKGWKPKRN